MDLGRLCPGCRRSLGAQDWDSGFWRASSQSMKARSACEGLTKEAEVELSYPCFCRPLLERSLN